MAKIANKSPITLQCGSALRKPIAEDNDSNMLPDGLLLAQDVKCS